MALLTLSNLILVGALFFALLVPLIFKINYKKKRHLYNIRTGDKVLEKLKSFNGEFRDQQIITYLRKVSPYVFEELVLSSLINKGYQVQRNKSYSGDGGLDGLFIHENKKYLVQVKRYKSKIKTEHVHDFSRLVKNMQAAGGYFIHTGSTATTTLENFRTSGIKIISGARLIDLILSEKIIRTNEHDQRKN